MTVGGIFPIQPRQIRQLSFQRRQTLAQPQREKIIRRAMYRIVRNDLTPPPQHPINMARLRPKITELLAEVGEAHGRGQNSWAINGKGGDFNPSISAHRKLVTSPLKDYIQSELFQGIHHACCQYQTH
jgi:hypothetical protein